MDIGPKAHINDVHKHAAVESHGPFYAGYQITNVTVAVQVQYFDCIQGHIGGNPDHSGVIIDSADDARYVGAVTSVIFAGGRPGNESDISSDIRRKIWVIEIDACINNTDFNANARNQTDADVGRIFYPSPDDLSIDAINTPYQRVLSCPDADVFF